MSDAPAAAASRWYRRIGVLGAGTLGMLAVLALVVAAADRSRLRVDWSADHRFTIDANLAAIIDRQTEPVRLVEVWNAADATALADVDTALRLAAGHNPRLSVERIDPQTATPLLAEFRNRFGEPAPPALWVVRGERTFRIGATSTMRRNIQRDLGGALVAVADNDPPLAVVMQDHGELRPGASGADGGGELLRTLSLRGWRVATADARRSAPIPPQALIVVPGPTANLGERDLRDLDAHLTDGGGMLVFADDRCPADLSRWLRRHGLVVGQVPTALVQQGRIEDLLDDQVETRPAGTVRSLSSHWPGQEPAFPNHNLVLPHDAIHDHPALGGLAQRGVPLLSPHTSRVGFIDPRELTKEPAFLQRWQQAGSMPAAILPLLSSLPGDAWMQPRGSALVYPKDLPADSVITLAVAAEYPPSPRSARAGLGGRIVAWGSRQAASDEVLQRAEFANAQAIADLATWAGRRGAAVDIPPAEVMPFQVTATPAMVTIVLALIAIILPCALVGAAILMWWDRR
jgi:hypothetical protein